MGRVAASTIAPIAGLVATAAAAFAWRGAAGVTLWLMMILAPLLVLRPGFWLVLRPLSRRRRVVGRSARYVGWVALLWAGLGLAVFSQRGWLLSGRLEMPLAARIAGILIGLLSPLLTISATRSLGWERAICVPVLFGEKPGKPPTLVVSGPYRFVRNPMYVSEMCALVGCFLFAGFPSLLCMFLLWLPMTGFVIPLEEQELRDRFGPEQYDAYARRVARLIPGLW